MQLRHALIALSLLLAACASTPANTPDTQPAGFHGLSATELNGNTRDFASLRGKVVLVCNAASQCGYNSQLDGFEKLRKDYGARGFEVVVMPSDDWDFERDTPEAMRKYYYEDMKYSYVVLELGKVKDGPEQAPLFDWLQAERQPLPEFNFYKYLVGRDGKPIKHYRSGIRTWDAGLLADIEAALKQPAPGVTSATAD